MAEQTHSKNMVIVKSVYVLLLWSHHQITAFVTMTTLGVILTTNFASPSKKQIKLNVNV